MWAFFWLLFVISSFLCLHSIHVEIEIRFTLVTKGLCIFQVVQTLCVYGMLEDSYSPTTTTMPVVEQKTSQDDSSVKQNIWKVEIMTVCKLVWSNVPLECFKWKNRDIFSNGTTVSMAYFRKCYVKFWSKM